MIWDRIACQFPPWASFKTADVQLVQARALIAKCHLILFGDAPQITYALAEFNRVSSFRV